MRAAVSFSVLLGGPQATYRTPVFLAASRSSCLRACATARRTSASGSVSALISAGTTISADAVGSQPSGLGLFVLKHFDDRRPRLDRARADALKRECDRVRRFSVVLQRCGEFLHHRLGV